MNLTRRAFLTGVSSAALCAGSSEARLLLPGSTAAAFNGGKTQVNLNFVASTSSFPFVDMAKSGSQPVTGGAIAHPSIRDSNGYPTSGTWAKTVILPLPTQKAGDYLLMWSGGGPNTVIVNPGGKFVSGSLKGANGTYRFTPSANAVNANVHLTVGVATTGTGYSPVTNLSVVNVNDLAAWQADPNAFAPEFLAVIATGKFGVIRFLNWQGSAFGGANQAMWTDWRSRKPVNYNSLSGAEWRANWWAGNPDNGGSGNDYTLTTPAWPAYIFGNGAPVDKQIMHVRFNQAATFVGSSTVTFSGNTVNWSGNPFVGNEPVTFGKIRNNLPTGLWSSQTYYVVASSIVSGVSFQISLAPGGAAIRSFGTGASGNYSGIRLPTLNINSTGAYSIRNAWGDPPGRGDIPISTSGSKPVYGTMIFDADMQAWLKTGANRNDGSQGLNNGVPPEVMLNLAIKARAHPWFVSSAFALDPMTDFWPTFVAYIQSKAPSWMIPRYEAVNEQWNFGGAFWNTRYGWNKSWFHWGLQFATNHWQGKIASTMGQAISNAYGGVPDGTKYWFINGMQYGSAYFNSITVTQNNERMNSKSYIGQSVPAQSGYTKTAAYLYTTHVAHANYLTPGAYQTLSELQTAINYSAVHLTNPAAQAADLNTYADTLIGASVSGTSILTIASPGQLIWPSHGLTTGQQVVLYTTGTLPKGLSTRVVYWVTVVDSNTLELSPSSGGSLVNFTGTQSGTQTAVVVSTWTPDVSMVAAAAQAFSAWASGFTNNASNPVGLTFYEGGWSPDTGGGDASTSVSSITAPGSTTTVTVASTTTLQKIGRNSTVSGVAALVGGAVSFSGIGGMTQLNTSSFGNMTFAGGGSANISATNSLVLNQAVSFIGGSPNFQLPPEITPGAPYYVVSIGNPFQISKTRGGPPLTIAGGSVGFAVTAYPGWFVTNVSGQNITLDVDSTSFGAYTSGGTMIYNSSGQQITNLRENSRLASDLQGFTYGNRTPVPSLFASLVALGGEFPSKFQLDSTGDGWGALQPTIYQPYPTTGEWLAIQAFSPNYH